MQRKSENLVITVLLFNNVGIILCTLYTTALDI